jgi:prevent-host-death family protein
MTTVDMQQAKRDLSRLVERAAAGEEIVITKAGKPMARLVPIAKPPGPRPLGVLAGQVRESADWWVPDAGVDALFAGSPAEPESPDITPKPASE